jgi:CDP-glycerol glycerophosphotransferase (TagB/SpsB family)
MTRRQVVFDSRIPAHFMVVRPVLDALRNDPRVDVWVCSAEGRADTTTAFVEAGLGDRQLTRDQCAWRRFDVYMNGDPWCVAPLHRCAHWINFFHGVAGKYDLDRPPRDAHLFDLYDRVAFINRDRMQRYLESGIVRPDQVALVGYPKLDRLVSGAADGIAVRRRLGLDVDRATAIYAPTWSSASSLHLAGEAIVETLLSKGLNVIAKLHDNCFRPGERCAGDIDWRERLQRFAADPQFHLATSADSVPYMAASDILITDHSSIGFEALAVDQPVIVFDAPDLPRVARINPEKVALLRSAADVVSTVDELATTVTDVLCNPSRRSADRRRVASEMFYAPGGATSRALEMIYRLLGLPAPAQLTSVASGFCQKIPSTNLQSSI